VITSAEADVLLGPIEILWRGWWGGGGEIHLSRYQLLLSIGDAPFLDHAYASSRLRVWLKRWRVAFSNDPVNHVELSRGPDVWFDSVRGTSAWGLELLLMNSLSWWSTRWWRWRVEGKLPRDRGVALIDCRFLCLGVGLLQVYEPSTILKHVSRFSLAVVVVVEVKSAGTGKLILRRRLLSLWSTLLPIATLLVVTSCASIRAINSVESAALTLLSPATNASPIRFVLISRLGVFIVVVRACMVGVQ